MLKLQVQSLSYDSLLEKRRWNMRGGIRVSYAKSITLENPYTKYVLEWLNEIKNPDDYLFPGNAKKGTRIVTRHWKNKEGIMVEKTYAYEDKEEGCLTRELCWKIIKFLNPNAWTHLFRASVATAMSEEGATEDALMYWFDWDSAVTAHRYVKRSGKMVEKWSKRLW